MLDISSPHFFGIAPVHLESRLTVHWIVTPLLASLLIRKLVLYIGSFMTFPDAEKVDAIRQMVSGHGGGLQPRVSSSQALLCAPLATE